MICTQCETEFFSDNVRRRRCDDCARYYQGRWAAGDFTYRNNPEHRKSITDRYVRARARNIGLLKQAFGDGDNFVCDCGFTSPHKVQFDFHHPDPAKKGTAMAGRSVSISRSLRTLSFSVAPLLLEGVKLLCTNCHRLEHSRSRLKRSLEYLRLLYEKRGLKLACQRCGFDKGVVDGDMAALDFHHLHPEEKRSYRRYQLNSVREALECALICARCHM